VAVLRAAEAARRSLDEDRAVHSTPKVPEKTAERPGVRLHPTVAVDGDVEIGEGTAVWHFSKLLGPCRIGRNCTFGQNVVVERHVTVGDNVKIQNNVSVYSGVILEDDVFCGPSMVFTNVGTPRSGFPRKGQYTTTLVKRGASIGANATVVCGHTLGRYCFVGAGAVVTRDVPDYALVFGNPARLRGWACFCGATLPLGTDAASCEEAACPDCGRRYAREGHVVRELDAAG
jgi:UDP-2-acetamido-3-amino-2,3-dideoxy-glucuronate N-acetyltransferase